MGLLLAVVEDSMLDPTLLSLLAEGLKASRHLATPCKSHVNAMLRNDGVSHTRLARVIQKATKPAPDLQKG